MMTQEAKEGRDVVLVDPASLQRLHGRSPVAPLTLNEAPGLGLTLSEAALGKFGERIL